MKKKIYQSQLIFQSSDNDNDIYNNGLLKRIGEWEILKK